MDPFLLLFESFFISSTNSSDKVMSKAAIISSFVATLIVSVEIISTSVRAIIASLAVSAWALAGVS